MTASVRPVPDLPAPADMAQALRDRLPGFDDIAWVAETGSTNTDLLATLRSQPGLSGPRLLGAHWQHAGRGRAGRTLHNQPGDTLMFSCAFSVRMASMYLPALSPVAGLAACEALRRQARDGKADALLVKWPNDIQFGDAKLAGLLVESTRDTAAGPGAHWIVIGMGMNLRNREALSAQLQRPIADWSQAGGGASLAALVADAALAWRDALDACARDGFGGFLPRFRALDALHGQTVNVIGDGCILRSGVALGLDPQGRLLIDDGDGPAAISVGEISIRARQS